MNLGCVLLAAKTDVTAAASPNSHYRVILIKNYTEHFHFRFQNIFQENLLQTFIGKPDKSISYIKSNFRSSLLLQYDIAKFFD